MEVDKVAVSLRARIQAGGQTVAGTISSVGTRSAVVHASVPAAAGATMEVSFFAPPLGQVVTLGGKVVSAPAPGQERFDLDVDRVLAGHAAFEQFLSHTRHLAKVTEAWEEKGRNKRRSLRIPADLRVLLLFRSKDTSARLVDISEGGVCVLTDEAFEEGDPLFIEFLLQSKDTENPRMPGRVVRASPPAPAKGQPGYTLGIQFDPGAELPKVLAERLIPSLHAQYAPKPGEWELFWERVCRNTQLHARVKAPGESFTATVEEVSQDEIVLATAKRPKPELELSLEFDVLHMGLQLSFKGQGQVQDVEKRADQQHEVRLLVRQLMCLQTGTHNLVEDGLLAELDRRISGWKEAEAKARRKGAMRFLRFTKVSDDEPTGLRRLVRSPVFLIPAAVALLALAASGLSEMATPPDSDLLFEAALEAQGRAEDFVAKAKENPLGRDAKSYYVQAAQAYGMAIDRFEMLLQMKPDMAATIDPLLNQTRADLSWCQLKLPSIALPIEKPVARPAGRNPAVGEAGPRKDAPP